MKWVTVFLLFATFVVAFGDDDETINELQESQNEHETENLENASPSKEHPEDGGSPHAEIGGDHVSEKVDFILTNHNGSGLSFNKDKDKWFSNFDYTCRTVYIIPDYLWGKSKLYQLVIHEYMQLDEPYNLIFCDWPTGYNADYIRAAESVRDAGEEIGQHIIKLYGEEQNEKTIEIVGHGMGAHIAGCAGRTTSNLFEVDAIYGLSPRGPIFDDLLDEFRLIATDAAKVICLHTIRSGVGSSLDCGKYDFYANKAQKQPGIIYEYEGCYSSIRSVFYFKEALSSEGFVAKGALGYPVTRFGRTMPKNTPQGKYYFTTNSKPPYCPTQS